MEVFPSKQGSSPAENTAYPDNNQRRSRIGFRFDRVPVFGLFALLLVATAGCSDGLQSTWDAKGPVAEKQLDLFYFVLWTMVGVFVVVEGILLYTIIRYRRRPNQALPKQVHGNTPLEVTWTIIPALLIAGVGVWTVITIFDLEDPPAEAGNALTINVTGHQWWWEFNYPDAGSGKVITTANELRIPVGRAISVNLTSDDVIHSFWIPKLAGKVDVIPTRTNTYWFQADEPGEYFGQCAEFCGIAHALMKFRVQVLPEAEYNGWVQGYGRSPVLSAKAAEGQNIFRGTGGCVLCHTTTGPDDRAVVQGRVKGFLGGGPVAAGPNLTDLATRHSFAAGLLDLNQENLRRWLNDPNDVKPGNYMAERAVIYRGGRIGLNDDQVSALIEYLLSLK